MKRFEQNVQLLNYSKGDVILAEDVNTLAITIYNKFNALIPDNIKPVTTGQFLTNNGRLFPNYVGYLYGLHIVQEYAFLALDKEIDRINIVLDKLGV